MFVLVAIGLVVNAYDTLNEHTSSALEQMTSEKLKEFSHAADQTQLQMRAGTDPGTFGALVVTVDAVSSDVMYDCSSRQIQPTTRDGSDGSAVLGCAWQIPSTIGSSMNDASSSSVTVCRMSWVCSVPSTAQGSASLTMRLPVSFQAMAWSARTTSWVQRYTEDPSKVTAISRIGGRSNTTLSGVLMASLATLPTSMPGRARCAGMRSSHPRCQCVSRRGFARVNLTAGLTSGGGGGGSGEGDSGSVEVQKS